MRRYRSWILVILTLLASAVVGLHAGTAAGEETITSGEVELEQRLQTNAGGGCQVTWWVVVDDLPDATRYRASLTRTSPSPAMRIEEFNAATIAGGNPFTGTPFDYPAPAGKLHHYAFQASSTLPCDPANFHDWEATSVEIVQFAVDPPLPGAAAIEVDLVPVGTGCQVISWVSVPEIPTATEYRVAYTIGGTSGRVVELTLRPQDFNSNPANVPAYDTPGRLGHFVRQATGSRGCPEAAWVQLRSGVAPLLQDGVSFEVTTRPCFGGQPTIIAVPGQVTRGTLANDVILGTDGRDVIRSGGGNDRICAFGGRDLVDGGPGDDRIDGGSANDTLRGGRGDDLLVGGRGTDQCAGGPGRDITRSCE